MGSKPPQHGSGGSMSSASNSQSENGPSATDPSLQQHPARSGQERPPAAAAQFSISQTCSQQAADQPSTAVGRAARGSLPPAACPRQVYSNRQTRRSGDRQTFRSGRAWVRGRARTPAVMASRNSGNSDTRHPPVRPSFGPASPDRSRC